MAADSPRALLSFIRNHKGKRDPAKFAASKAVFDFSTLHA
jgi:hypothetical protein